MQESGPIISFDFRKLHFILDSEDLTFRKLKYPTKVPGALLKTIPNICHGMTCNRGGHGMQPVAATACNRDAAWCSLGVAPA